MARPYIELYINNQKVEFTEPPQILLTYSHNEVHNPTIVKNSYSKTITVDGTPNNNKIFNCFADMRWVNGAGFNPSRKETFTLFRNGEPIETGYVKLDNVKKIGNRVQYQITLFGGLGQFLYNLSYSEDGEQRKLKDMDYSIDFKMGVNKTTIRDAWRQINGIRYTDDIYDVINFAPCYNGIPKDFSANKVAIDVESFRNADDTDLYNQFITSKDGYTTVDGWLIAELPQDYDEWQTKDLRSYLQRPVIRLKEIINACCNPDNNGGYEVVKDETFFNSENPYWENAWMTLPLLTEIEEVDEVVEDSYGIVNSNGKITITGLTENTRYKINIPMRFGADVDSTSQTLYTNSYTTMWDGSDESATYEVEMNVGRCVQLVAYDSTDTPITGSVINILSSKSLYGDITSPFPTTAAYVQGNYVRQDDGTYLFVGDNINLSINVTYQDGMYFKVVESFTTYGEYGNVPTINELHNYMGYTSFDVNSWFNDVADSNLSIEKIRGLDWYISKNSLLNSEHTPADYFLSYIKLFNLHIWKDMYENKIYVYKRQNFFTNEKYDIENLIDRSQTINITPLTFDAKWYNFKYDMETDGLLYKDYNNEYGIPYGIQKVDTNYNFDSSSKDLLENNAYKGCIMQRGKSKYYIDIRHNGNNGAFDYPSYCLDGFKTYLFNGDGDTTEGATITPKTTETATDWWTEKYYDIMPKPSFVDNKNEVIEGANVLLFYNGKQLTQNTDGKNIGFQLTDDIALFETLNDGEPCWIWSYDTAVVDDLSYGGAPYYGAAYLPNFSRYITNGNNWITHSWDFGTPKTLYVPDYNIDDSSNLYTQYWQSYIRDMYSVDTRIVECMVLLKERVIGDWLRRFYYFDGSYWVMNEITDYDITGNEPTKCTLIRINDTSNYL